MQCINKNSREYQTLKKQSGLSDFVLSAYVGDFIETHDRFPYLDELPRADSSKAISEDLSLNKDNTTKTENILQATNTNTVEEAVPVLNDKYRDKEIEILEVGSKSKVYITTRPNTTQNQDGETDRQIKIATEIADIKERAIANSTFMKAPNGKPTNLTEQQWLQVRTQEFKDWFGDWINDPENASKVVDKNGEPLVVYHGSKTQVSIFDSSKSNARQELSKTIIPTNFFSDDRTVADAFARTEKQSIANAIGAAFNEISEAQVEDENEVWQYVANSVDKSIDWVKNFWTNELSLNERMDASDGIMYDPNVEKQKYAVFLNLRNPIIIEANGKRADEVIENNKDIINNNDEVIIKNVDETVGKKEVATDYLVRQSNQIKSATNNTGPFSSSNDNINDDYENVNSFSFFNEIIDKLQTLYGINIIPITNAELSQDRWASITGTKGVKSFIYNGNIYINTDIATVDSPVHELLHLLFGSMKYQNRALYDILVGQAEQFDSYNTIAANYPNRTRGDVNEEVFVTELAKYLTGQNNAISNLGQSAQDEIMYNVNRTLDTVLMGENSIRCIENPYIMNLKTLAKLVKSSTMISEKRGSLDDATLNRIMANVKSDLMKNKELREECQ